MIATYFSTKPTEQVQSYSGQLFLKYLGETIAERRRLLGLNQLQFSEAVGLHRSYISDIERGSRNLGTINLVQIAQALGLPVWMLIARAEEAIREDTEES